jgi:hypothetical protein
MERRSGEAVLTGQVWNDGIRPASGRADDGASAHSLRARLEAQALAIALHGVDPDGRSIGSP